MNTYILINNRWKKFDFSFINLNEYKKVNLYNDDLTLLGIGFYIN